MACAALGEELLDFWKLGRHACLAGKDKGAMDAVQGQCYVLHQQESGQLHVQVAVHMRGRHTLQADSRLDSQAVLGVDEPRAVRCSAIARICTLQAATPLQGGEVKFQFALSVLDDEGGVSSLLRVLLDQDSCTTWLVSCADRVRGENPLTSADSNTRACRQFERMMHCRLTPLPRRLGAS